MSSKKYLKGFVPYRKHVIEEYTQNGAWQNLTYGDLLDRASSRHTNKAAVIDDRNRLAYGELKEKVDRFAVALIESGVKPHDRMIIQLPNRCEFIVAFYAFQKIGVIPVPAIPRHGYQEISAFFRLTEAVGWVLPKRDGKVEFAALIDQIRSEFECLKYLIMTEDNGDVPSPALSMDRLISDVKLEDYDPDYLDQFRPDPNDAAVLIPTGGTTGLPKMVPRTHNSLIVTNKYISRGIDDSDKTLQATPVGHAMALQGAVNCAIYRGVTLVLQGIPRPTEIMETIQKERITRMFLVPAQLQGIMNHPDLDKYNLSSLKIVGTTGAALSRETAQKAADYFTKLDCRFSGNALGASEGLLTKGNPSDPLEEQLKTVGRNITPGSHYKVIDEDEKELSPDMEGELVARGPEVFTGYYKATEKENSEVFTHDGYYRTGDLAKIDEHGCITITGRKKDVIMRGGETLIPSEMEALLGKHPDIDNVAVIGMPDQKLGERACAYVVLKPGKNFTFGDMIEFLKARGAGVLLLPERLEIIESLPLTGVGKVDKKGLRKDIEGKLKNEVYL